MHECVCVSDCSVRKGVINRNENLKINMCSILSEAV